MVCGRVHPIRCINRRVLGCLARLPWDSSHIGGPTAAIAPMEHLCTDGVRALV